MAPDRPIAAVTFDYWDTLMSVEDDALAEGRLAAWTDLLGRAGIRTEQRHLVSAHDHAFACYQAAWHRNEQFCVPDATARMLEHLALEVPEDLRTLLVEAFSEAGRSTGLRPAPGLGVTLEALRGAGIRTAIICDVGLTPSPILLEHLDRCGLLRHFDHWSFSDDVGVYKPGTAIFEHALEGLGGPEPSTVAHVGDRRRTDVAGARNSGLVSVRYAGIFDDVNAPEPDADIVTCHHDELLGALGIPISRG